MATVSISKTQKPTDTITATPLPTSSPTTPFTHTPTQTVTPSPTLIPDSTQTPPTYRVIITELADQWRTYEDEDVGVSFEYPAIYDHPENIFCPVWAFKNESDKGYEITIVFTQFSEIRFQFPAEKPLEEVLADLYIRDEEDDAFVLEDINDDEFLGGQGYSIEYRVNGRYYTGGFGEYMNDNFVSTTHYFLFFQYCDFPEIGIPFFEAWGRFQETLEFSDLTG
ncbi:MAG: hypothetical protein JRJ00_03295 [Deltaproteobacteria bacterium]|nr:hypothetical protein [Deltaproteobacteria bacterium]